MSRSFRLLCALVAVAATISFAGCPSSTTEKVPEAGGHEGHDHAHDHASEGPHGGHLIELGEEKYHAEWTHDESGKVTIYILDGEAKKEVPIAAEMVTIEVKVGDNPKSYELLAVNRTEGDMPTAFQFETVNPSLLGGLEAAGQGVDATLVVDINGEPFQGSFVHEEGHEGHKH